MRYVFATAALFISIGSTAIAQETYDEIIESGGLDSLSNMETHIATILENNGVSRECMGNLTVSDAVQINAILNRSDDSRSEKERDVTVILDRRCN
jgi:hypothetical protein